MPRDTAPAAQAGLTVRDVARRYRVGEDKVRNWIRRGELAAVNTSSALCGKPRWIILPDSLSAFERRRAGGPPPKLKRRRPASGLIDYYPDGGEGGAA
jgi:transposase